ncbi:MAG: pilin [Patescibacteria group bacterium]
MKKRGIILVFFVGFLILFAFPTSATGIIPTSILPECINTPGGCTLCDVWPLADNIIRLLLFGLAIPVLTVTLIWGGVMWTTAGASTSNIEQGKKIMTSGIVGILIAFSGWLIVDTIIKTLASGGTVIGAWQDFPDKTACENPNLATEKITFENVVPAGMAPAKNWVAYRCLNKTDCVAGDNNKSTKLPGAYSTEEECKSTTSSIEGQETFSGLLGSGRNWICVLEVPELLAGSLTHAQAKALLDSAGVSISSTGNCSDKTQSTCTSLDGIQTAVINEVIKLKGDCGCSLIVTGGTETGHAAGTYSHSTGYKIDIARSGNLDRFISTSHAFLFTAPRGSGCHNDGPNYVRDLNRNISYVLETCPGAEHWDITVRP